VEAIPPYLEVRYDGQRLHSEPGERHDKVHMFAGL